MGTLKEFKMNHLKCNDPDIIRNILHESEGYSDIMNSHQTNAAFEPDDACNKSFSQSFQGRNEKQDAYAMDMKDLKAPKELPKEYDPYQHRKVQHPTTNSETLLHLLKGSLGTGILAMPKAFDHSGYILGITGTLIIGLICTYCIHLLIKAEYELCRRRKVPSLSYPNTAEAAFAEGPPIFRRLSSFSIHMVNTFLLIYQLGTCCVYIVFIATNIKSVADVYWKDIDVKYYMLMILLPLILMNWIRNLKLLAPFSTLANVITLISFGIILYYLIHDKPTFTDRKAIGDVADFPLFFGTVLFALEAIGVIMPLENEMKTPKSFGGGCGVLNIGMFNIIFLYVGMGFLGYLTYGSTVEGSITLNISQDDILAQVVKATLALAIFITYALQCYVAVDITWNDYLSPRFEKNSKKAMWEYIVRTVLVLITFGLAVAVPKLDLFISLFGALCLSALGIAIPALVDTSTYWYTHTGSRFYIILAKNIALIVFGIFGLIVGTYTSLEKIVEEFL